MKEADMMRFSPRRGLRFLEGVARHAVEVPVVPWPAVPRRVLRISAHLYNSIEQYERLGAAVGEELAAERGQTR